MSKTFSVMTYNVHSCVGTDGRISPLRIAEVIARYRPDVVALQELDAGLSRSDMIDQADLIAMTLKMSFHFHPSLQVEEGGYGNAVLSRSRVRLIQAGALPTQPLHPFLERRGALWVEVELEGSKIQVLTSHFGLDKRERNLQADCITGPEWLGNPEFRTPAVLCGDFNALPGSSAYRRITRRLGDAQRGLKGWRLKGTWPVQLPFMRIDHLFITPDLKVRSITVPRTPLTRLASDHLPLIVTLELP